MTTALKSVFLIQAFEKIPEIQFRNKYKLHKTYVLKCSNAAELNLITLRLQVSTN